MAIGDLIETPERLERARELDSNVHFLVRQAVELGACLLEMRNDSLFLNLGYDTFESYCEAVQGVGVRYARRCMQATVIRKCISPPHNDDWGPSEFWDQERTLRAIGEVDGISWEESEEKSANGLGYRIGILNPERVQESVEMAVKCHSQLCEEHAKEQASLPTEDRKPAPKLSASRIKKYLARQHFYPHKEGAASDTTPAGVVARAINKATEFLDKRSGQWSELAQKHNWDKRLKDSLRRDIKNLRIALENADDEIKRIRIANKGV